MNLSVKNSVRLTAYWMLGMLMSTGTQFAASAADDVKDSAKGPHIEFVETAYDVGTVNGEVGAQHIFKYKNTGDAALTIKEVKSTCGCTVPSWSKEPLAPGASGSITVTVHPVTVANPFSKSVHVISDDSSAPDIPLTIKGTFALEVNWLPSPFVFMGNVVGTATVVKTVNVRFEKPTKISEVISTSPIFKTTFKEIEPAKQYAVEISTVPPMKLGSASTVILAHTDDPKHARISCTATVNVVNSISCYPSDATFIHQAGGNWMGPQLLVRHNNGGKFHVTSVETSLKGLQLKLKTMSEGSSYQILIDKVAEDTVLPSDGEIDIHTDDKEVSLVKVPVHLR